MRDARTYIYFSLKMEHTHNSPQMGPKSTFLKKKTGGKYSSNLSFSTFLMNIYLGTSREKNEKEKTTILKTLIIGFTIFLLNALQLPRVVVK